MSNYYSTTIDSRNIQFLHRAIIAKALADKDSKTTIAKELGFSRQAIHNEIARGTIEHMKSDLTVEYVYDPYAAQYKHDDASHWKGRLSIIDDCKELADIIESGVKEKLSPEVIAHNINVMYKEGKITHRLCFKTIYNLVESNKLAVSIDDLLYAKKHRKKTHKEEKAHEKPEGGESIDLRADISSRIEFGHWEIDCVVGKREGKSTCLMTLVERKTRYGITVLIPKKSKKCIVNALKKIKSKFGKYFYDVFKTITADNGCEFKDAIGMSLKLKNGKQVKIYFAHAYHSWERGSNENYNRMIRRYFPKGTDFTKISNQQLQEVIKRINNYPRKQFNFETSEYRFINELLTIINDNNIIYKMI